MKSFAATVRFDTASIVLHWASAILVLGLFASAWSLSLAADAAMAASLLTLHRSLGVTLWIVAAGRLAWRLRFAVRPPLPREVPAFQRFAAAANESLLYAAMLAQPLTGLGQTLARGKPFRLFALEAPKLMARDKPLAGLFHQIHELTAWLLLALIAAHVGAALYHRFVRRDGVLKSMWPGAGPR
jgi:cytochrome b561